jgi:predicted PurR-regulated permease PerM
LSTPIDLSGVISNILSAIVTIISEFASALAANASTIATLVFAGVMVGLVYRYGSRLLRGVTSWFRGIF